MARHGQIAVLVVVLLVGVTHPVGAAMTGGVADGPETRGTVTADATVELNLTADPAAVEAGSNVTFHTVRNDTGEPVNATVTVANETLATGPDGNVTWTATNGTWTATASKNGTTESYVNDTTTVRVAEQVADLSLQVSSSSVTAGDSVTFTVKHPATSAYVNTTLRVGDRTFRLGDDGKRVVSFPDAGTYDVLASRERTADTVYRNASATVTVEKRRADLKLSASKTSVTPGEDVTFTVKNADTSNYANATLRIAGDTYRTGDDGKLVYAFQQEGTFEVVAEKADTAGTNYVNASVNVTANGAESNLKLSASETALRPGESVTFSVKSSKSSEHVNASLRLGDETRWTGSDGTLKHVFDEVGDYVVVASKPATLSTTYENDTVDVTVEKRDEPLALSVSESTVRPGEAVTFTAKNAYTSNYANASLAIVDNTYRTGADGKLTYAFEEEGTYEVVANKTDTLGSDYHNDTENVTVEKADVPLDVSVNTTSPRPCEPVQFVVKRGDTGNYANATVSVANHTVTTGEDGTLVLSLGVAGEFTATASKDDTFATEYRDDTVALTSERETVPLSLSANRTEPRPGQPVEFTVKDGSSGNVVNATLHLGDETVVTGPDGTATYTFAEPTAVTVNATKNQTLCTHYLNGSVNVTAERDVIEVKVMTSRAEQMVTFSTNDHNSGNAIHARLVVRPTNNTTFYNRSVVNRSYFPIRNGTGEDGLWSHEFDVEGNFEVVAYRNNTTGYTFTTDREVLDIPGPTKVTGNETDALDATANANDTTAAFRATVWDDRTRVAVNLTDATSDNRTVANVTFGPTAATNVTNVTSVEVVGDTTNETLTGNTSDVNVTVAGPANETLGGAAELTNASAVQYANLSVDGWTSATVENTTVRFSVGNATLPEGANATDVTLYRYANSTWSPVETVHLGDGHYTATLPGDGPLAVAVDD
ncbi:hypothetical protein LPA44_07355 [Halobacterium sp. KA-4]|uniref:PKD domain-containing protein n=1 Tax=Halobacterium sp. KA-4 TaxID=2896367 RepID=UPI001E5A3D63|nr:hypothetical protein [Halobacterium sp. KA-4]MCD2199712.1 hypothetical protein [Halobacterium sp. KA-4]